VFIEEELREGVQFYTQKLVNEIYRGAHDAGAMGAN